ncbi:MAG TPA: hypothetical protein VJC03_00725 [bacterium]|nr:hypothetical protein [bacterium]
MKKIAKVALFSFHENRRNQNFYILLLFAFMLMAAGFLFSRFSTDVEERIIRDAGLGAIEFFAFLSAVFLAARQLISEIESKTIYTILTKPIPRSRYFLGRYCGVTGVILFGILIMGILLTGLLFLKGKAGSLNSDYYLAYVNIYFKILMITALSFFFSLLSTSVLSSMVFTGFLWIIGHLSEEIKFLAREASPLLFNTVRLAYWIFPNFSYLNTKSFPADAAAFGYPVAVWSILYVFSYTAVFLIMSIMIFGKKDL